MLVRSNFRLSVYSLISDLDAVKIESPSFVPFFTSQTFSTTPSTLSFFLKTPLYPQRFSKTAHPYGNDCQNDYFLIKPAATNNKNIKKRSVSTERWFGAHSARRFKKPPIHPLGKQKSTSRDTFFVVRGGFAQQRACKFTCQSEVWTPKGGSTRKACGCLKTA